jgi:hypothetical protein
MSRVNASSNTPSLADIYDLKREIHMRDSSRNTHRTAGKAVKQAFERRKYTANAAKKNIPSMHAAKRSN